MIPDDRVGKKPWVAVKKKRSQRLYKGIMFELTQLSVQNDDWWSIAFEGAEENTNRLDSFVNIVSEVSQNHQGLELLFDSSYAYPRWFLFVISSQRSST